MKTLAMYICPRCLILKADVPHVGKNFDMNRWQLNLQKYSPEKVEVAWKSIFDGGRSVGYKGEFDPLKVGSWVPTRVWMFPTLVLGSAIDGILTECIFHRT